MAGFDNDVVYSNNVDFSGAGGGRGGNATMLLDGQLLIGRTSLNAGGTNIDVGTLTAGSGVTITNGPGSITLGLTGGAVAVQHLTGDTGGQLNPDGSNNFNLLGQKAGTIPVFDTIGSASTISLEDRAWLTQFVVDPSAVVGLRATFTTIQAAITASVSGQTIFIRPGTYTENLTLKAGVNLTAFLGDSLVPNVIIIGKATFNTAGTCSISNIQLQTNADFFLAVTGTLASIVQVNNCNLICSNNTGISHTVSNTLSVIGINNCLGNITTTGIALFSSSSTGTINIDYSIISNTGSSTTASTMSAGTINLFYTTLNIPITTSSTGALGILNSTVDTSLMNTTSLTLNGSGSNFIVSSYINSNTASAISINGISNNISNSVVNSTNTNAITGTGTLTYSGISFNNTSSKINTTTLVARNTDTGGISFDGGTNTLNVFTQGTFTPTIVGSTAAGAITYTIQIGRYQRVGRIVSLYIHVAYSGNTGGTGNIQIQGLPFISANIANLNSDTPISAGSTQLSIFTNTFPLVTVVNNTSQYIVQSFSPTTGSRTIESLTGRTTGDYIINSQYEV